MRAKTSRARLGDELKYELVQVHRLPTIDLTKSIKSLIFSHASIPKVNTVLRRIAIPSIICYYATFVAMLVALVAPANTGRWIAFAQLVLQIPLTFSGLLLMRVDLLRCLLTTYDFWFFSTVSLVSCIVLAFHLGDLRATMAISYCMSVQLNICSDANLQTRYFAVGTAVGVCVLAVLIPVTIMGEIPRTVEFEIFRYHGRSVTSLDVLANLFATVLIRSVRAAFRKNQALKRQGANPMFMRCESYRCTVKLREDQARDWNQQTRKKYNLTHTTDNQLRTRQPLRLVHLRRTYYDRDIVVPTMNRALPAKAVLTKPKQAVLYGTGALGYLLTMNVFFFTDVRLVHVGHLVYFVASLVGCCCSFCFCTVVSCFYQRQLLSSLVFSFDFVFLSMQLTMAHICMCDLLFWDVRSFAVLSNWLILHLVLTMDALTPAMKRRLNCPSRYLRIFVMVCFVIAMMASSSRILFTKADSLLQDRALWKMLVSGREMTFYMVPFFLGRIWTLLLWSCRILWRLFRQEHADALIIAQGSVEYYGDALSVRSKKMVLLPGFQTFPSAPKSAQRSRLATFLAKKRAKVHPTIGPSLSSKIRATSAFTRK